MRKLHWPWLAVGWLCVAVNIYLSLTPSRPGVLPKHVSYADVLEHALAYGLMMLWFCQAYQRQARRVLLAILLIALGIGLEFLQRKLGHRHFSYRDMLANSAGVLAGWLCACTILGRIGLMLEAKLGDSGAP